MSNISRINNQTRNSYEKLSSGKKINRAKDDAAGKKIVEKTKSQITGLDQGTRNMQDAKNFLNVADSTLNNINDSLQRLRELAVQAANSAIYGEDDIKAMQDETTELIKGIDEISQNAEFNKQQVLKDDTLKIETGSGKDAVPIDTSRMDVERLGLTDFNIAQDDAIKKIDEAIKIVNDERSKVGTKTNRLDYAIDYNKNASIMANATESRIEDLDYSKGVSEKKKNEVLGDYSIQMKKKELERNEENSKRLLGL